MAENALKSCHNNEDLNSCLRISNGKVSQYQFHSQWMAHWKQESDGYNLCDASNKDTLHGGYLNVENIKTRRLKLFSTDLSHENTSEDKNTPSPDLHELGLTLYSQQSAEPLVAEKGRCKSNNSLVKKSFKLNGTDIVVSDILSLRELPDSSLHLGNKEKCQCLNIRNVSSEENHFPMYDINRKIESILDHQKRIGYVNMAGLSELQMSPEKIKPGDQFSGGLRRNTFEENEPSELLKGSPCCHDSYRRSSTNALLNGQIPNVKLHKDGKEKSSLSTEHMLCKHSAEPSFTNLRYDMNNFYEPSRNVREMGDDNEMIATGARSSWPWKTNGFIRAPRDTQSVHHSANKIPNSPMHNVETLRIQASSNSMDTINGQSPKVSNSFHYWLITEKIPSKLSHEEQLNVNFTDSLKSRSGALYEMITVPTTSECQSKQQEFSQLVVSSNSIRGDEKSDRSDAHVIETRSYTSVKSATIPFDVHEKQNSAEAVVSNKLHKDLEQPRLIKSHHASDSPAKQGLSGDAETDVLDTNALCLASSDRSGSIDFRGLSTSRTESMNVDQVLSHVWRPNGSSSVGVKESSSQVEPCSRWLKRLQRSPLDSLHNNTKTKRSRIGDASSTREAFSLLNKVTDNNTSRSGMIKMKHLMEKQISDEMKHLQSNMDCPPEASLKKIQCWVGRWCGKGSQIASSEAKAAAAAARASPSSSKLIPESHDGKLFPSIGAMALMGRVMNNLRTCEFQSRGSSVVWNTKSL